MKTALSTSNPRPRERRAIPIFIPRLPEDTPHWPLVSILGHRYLVDFGPGLACRFHRVSKNRECACGNPNCPAIEAVRQYLKAGGKRAPDPEAMPPCPICGGRTYRDRVWDGRYTGELGWRCVRGGLSHFLENKASRIQKQFAVNPWLFPPAPGYPGLRREDVLTQEEYDRQSQEIGACAG